MFNGKTNEIIDNNSNSIVKYTYDAWGNVVSAEYNNLWSMLLGSRTYTAYNISNLSGFGYRSYYYDSDLELYYLISRYYDSTVGRFISPDDTQSLDFEILFGHNRYVYCADNPIRNQDPDGNAFFTALLIGAIIGFAIGFTSSAVGQYIDGGEDWENVNWGMAIYDGVWGAVNGALATTGIGMGWSVAISAGIGAVSSIGSDLLFNDGNINVENLICSTVIGGVSGLIAGGGSKKSILKFMHSRDILNRTIANGTKHAITRQTNAMLKHAKSLFVSGVRYAVANSGGGVVSKQLDFYD